MSLETLNVYLFEFIGEKLCKIFFPKCFVENLLNLITITILLTHKLYKYNQYNEYKYTGFAWNSITIYSFTYLLNTIINDRVRV